MQIDTTIRICTTCKHPLAWSETETGQTGWICCDQYFCSQKCLDESFEGTGETWLEHYETNGGDENSDCYNTDWELEEVTA